MEHEITVELKNEVQIRGTLKSVDQYLNIKLDNAEAVDELRWPHLVRFYPPSSSFFTLECETSHLGNNKKKWEAVKLRRKEGLGELGKGKRKMKANEKVVLNQGHVHSRFRCTLRTSTFGRGRYSVIGGRDEEGGGGGEKQGEVRGGLYTKGR